MLVGLILMGENLSDSVSKNFVKVSLPVERMRARGGRVDRNKMNLGIQISPARMPDSKKCLYGYFGM